MATQETRAELIEIVVAMFDAAPGVAVLSDLVTASDAGNSNALIAASLANSAEFKGIFPTFQTNAEFVSKFVDQMVGSLVSDAEKTTVKNALTGEMNLGATRVDVVLTAVKALKAIPTTDTVWGNASAAFANKVEVATYHTVEKQQATTTLADLQGELAGVDNTAASVTDAKAELEGEAAAGETFTLTTGLDTLTGTAGDDTFSAQDNAGALINTLTTGDNLNGGAGTDTLSIVVSGTGITGTSGIATTGIEAVSVYNNQAGPATPYAVDATLMTGLTDLYVNGGTEATSFTTVGSLANLHLISTNHDATVGSTAATGAADAAIILSNSSAQTLPLTATYDGLEVINFVAAGATGVKTASVDRSLTLASTDLEKVVVTGDAAANLTVNLAGAALETQTSEFDASAAGGSITAHITKGASATAAVTMSAQADYLDFNGALTNTITLDGGDGVDTLELDTALAYSAAAATAGTDQAGAGVSNFEVLYLAAGNGVDERALTNNAGITTVISLAGGSYTNSTALASITQLSSGAFTTTAATDGAADALTINLAGAGVTSTLSAANVETLTVGSAGTDANAVTMSAAGSADLTSITAAGSKGLTLTISGTSLANVDASGITGVGSAFTLSAAASDVDMTVTASANRPTVAATGIANTITVGDGDNTITGGAYRDDITAGDGDNTVVAGDGNNTVTTGKGDDTITAGDGDNTIDAGSGDNTVTVGDGTNDITLGKGDDTVTAGGTTTSAKVMDVNTVDLGAGDDTYTGGAGRDIVTLGTGDDTVNTGAGADSIYASSFDDDDVIDGGAGTDALSSQELTAAATLALTGAQIQPVANYVDLNPGTTRTSTPQITGVESVYMDVVLDATNAGTVATRETVDFSASSGISNLYLDTSAGDTTSVLILNEVDAAAIHLTDSVAGGIAGLTVVGTGQASLTLKGHANAGATAITVTETDAVTLTSYVDNATAAVVDTVFGDVTADEATAVTVTGAGVSNVIGAQAFTTGDISADAVETLTLSAGSNMTLTTGAIGTAGDELQTIAITVSDDGTLVLPSITATAGDIEASTMTINVGVGGDFGNVAAPTTIAADSIETATVTVGAAATLRADFTYAGTTTLTASAGSTVDIDTIGLAGQEASFTISGRGTFSGGAGSVVIVNGETTFNYAGYNNGGAITVTATDASDKTIIGNNEASIINTGAGADSVTGGAGADTITTGGGDDVIIAGAGDDVIDPGAGADTITTGTGSDDILIDLVAESAASVAANTTRTFDLVTDFTTTEDEFDIAVVADLLAGADATGVTVTAITTAAGSLADTTIDDFAELKVAVDALGLTDSAAGAAGAATGLQIYTIDLTGNTGDLGTGYYVLLNNDDAVMTADDVLIQLTGVTAAAGAPVAGDFII